MTGQTKQRLTTVVREGVGRGKKVIARGGVLWRW